MSFNPLFRSVAGPQEPRRYSAPDVLAFFRHARNQQGEDRIVERRRASMMDSRPKSSRMSSTMPPPVEELDLPAARVGGPIFVDLGLGQPSTASEPPQDHLERPSSRAHIGLGLSLPADDDADDILVNLLPSPSHRTNVASSPRLPNPRATTDDSLESYPVAPPGLTNPFSSARGRVVETYFSESSSTSNQRRNIPSIVVITPEDDLGVIAIDIVPPTPDATSDTLDMLAVQGDTEDEDEDDIIIEVTPPSPVSEQYVVRRDVPSTPRAPRLPHITRFLSDPLYT
ncbi:hypothetical protein DAEQUDRAFT_523670 [Daedalea quercina L-15889]|uniref:Uncharacterized protein n=1 Tax=Daedalea quercina L-15889 TaxID=1314783 RepID=A0A165MB19_9APHY|nr:hypothetical protein DAEQUDRAFT_523670 [Daedalea quercina L-15889]